MDHPDDPAVPTTMVPTSPQALVQHLRGYEGQLPEAVRRPLVAAGASILPALIALVEDALADDQTAWGWAPLHAIDLLGALGDARTLPVLLRCLDLEDELDLRVEQAEAALRALGARALEGCVAAYAASPQGAFRDRLAGVMSQWGLHDERLYAALLDTLQRTPELGANYLVDCGDPRAVEVLAQTFDALPIRAGDNLLANHIFIELRCAIEELGGQLTTAQQDKFAQADAPRRRFVAQLPWDLEAPALATERTAALAPASAARPRPLLTGKRKLGRNAPCWCGSGKKYKKCHLPVEEQASPGEGTHRSWSIIRAMRRSTDDRYRRALLSTSPPFSLEKMGGFVTRLWGQRASDGGKRRKRGLRREMAATTMRTAFAPGPRAVAHPGSVMPS